MHAGKEGPHLAMTGAYGGFSQAAASVWGFSRGTTGSSNRSLFYYFPGTELLGKGYIQSLLRYFNGRTPVFTNGNTNNPGQKDFLPDFSTYYMFSYLQYTCNCILGTLHLGVSDRQE